MRFTSVLTTVTVKRTIVIDQFQYQMEFFKGVFQKRKKHEIDKIYWKEYQWMTKDHSWHWLVPLKKKTEDKYKKVTVDTVNCKKWQAA